MHGFIQTLNQRFAKLSLGTKIYVTITAILIPIFTLTVFFQSKVTRPLLEDEVKQIGLSVCRAISLEIATQKLHLQPEKLEARLIELTWSEPSIVKISVITKNESTPKPVMKVIASNVEDDAVYELMAFEKFNSPQTTLHEEDGRKFWEIIYPVQNKNRNKTLAYIKTEISMKLVEKVTELFSRIAILASLAAVILSIWILSIYLKRVFENEKRLQVAETQNLELIQQLDEAQRQLFLNEKLAIMGQLTASFAHEIGTPLNSLSGHLQLLQAEIVDHSRLDIINSQVQRIENIVKEFLASTHVPSKQKQLVDVRHLTDRIISLINPRLSLLKIEVHTLSDETIKPIRIVPSEMEQILINLANNALDALEESEKQDKKIDFIISSKNNELFITVRDNGNGIRKENLKNVLKPFYTTKAPGKGTGLGLAICQRLVKKYGGKLDLESELGKGTRVTVKIPYDKA